MDQKVLQSKAKLPWVIGLSVAAMSITLAIVISVIVGFGELRWLVVPFALRGTVVAAWFISIIFIVTLIAALSLRSFKSYSTLLNVLLGMSVLAAIMTMVAGIDLARVFTSPVTLSEHLGDAFSKMISNSPLAPKSMRNQGGESIVTAVTHITASIAVMQLIGFLPFPYNAMLFFMYYKFVTVLIVCLIPLSFALWAVFLVYSARNEILENQETIGDSSSEDDYGTFEYARVRDEGGWTGTYRAVPTRKQDSNRVVNYMQPAPHRILSPSSTFYQG